MNPVVSVSSAKARELLDKLVVFQNTHRTKHPRFDEDEARQANSYLKNIIESSYSFSPKTLDDFVDSLSDNCEYAERNSIKLEGEHCFASAGIGTYVGVKDPDVFSYEYTLRFSISQDSIMISRLEQKKFLYKRQGCVRTSAFI